MLSTGLDLLEKLLTFDPTARIGVEDALEHPYFELFHDADDEVCRTNVSLNIDHFPFTNICYSLHIQQP